MPGFHGSLSGRDVVWCSPYSPPMSDLAVVLCPYWWQELVMLQVSRCLVGTPLYDDKPTNLEAVDPWSVDTWIILRVYGNISERWKEDPPKKRWEVPLVTSSAWFGWTLWIWVLVLHSILRRCQFIAIPGWIAIYFTAPVAPSAPHRGTWPALRGVSPYGLKTKY